MFKRLLLTLAALLTLCGSGGALAETIPANSTTVPNTVGMSWYVAGTAVTNQPSAVAACIAANPSWTTTVQITYKNHQCRRTSDGYMPGFYATTVCQSGGTAAVQDVGGLPSCGAGVPSYSCTAGQNWTLSGSNCTRPDCTAQQTRNPATGVCEAIPCISTSAATGSQWFDQGVTASSVQKFACVSGCMAMYSGESVSKSSIIDGVRRYYSYGSFDYTGAGAVDVCTAGAETPAVPAGALEVPVAHCASNQIEGLIDGKLNCWNVPETAGAAPTLANPDVAATTTATGTTTVSTVGDTTTTTTTTTNNNGGTTTIIEACTLGNCTTSTQDSGKDQTQTTAGTGAATTGLYTADTGGKTFSGVLTSFKNTVAAAPIASAAGGFFQAGTFSGNCSAMSFSVTMLGNVYAFDGSEIFCGATALTWYSYLAAGLLLIATALAFWIAVL